MNEANKRQVNCASGHSEAGGDKAHRAMSPLALNFAGTLSVVGAMWLYHAFWWNRVLAIHAGAGSFLGAIWTLQNFLPYRDYFLPTCPLSCFCGTAAVAIFGKFYYVTKSVGVIERITFATIIFFWLRRFFKTSHAVFASIVAAIAGSGSFTDPLDAFHQQSELYAVASGFCASYLFSSRKRATYIIFACLTGIFAALCMCTKQSLGTITALVIPIGVTISLFRRRDGAAILQFLSLYLGAYTVIIAILGAWLYHLGILSAFLNQVFVEGPAAKAASPADYFNRFVLVSGSYFLCYLAAACVVFQTTRKIFRSAASKDSENDLKSLLVASVLSFISIAAGIVYAFSHTEELVRLTPGMVATAAYFKIAVLLTLIGNTVYAFSYVIQSIRCIQSEKQTQFFIYAFVSCITLLASSLSFPLTNEALLPGLGLIVASTLDKLNGWRLGIVYFLWCLLIFGATELKCTIPFGFQAIYEQAGRLSVATSKQPALKGFVLPRKTVDFLDGALDVIKEHTQPGDTIFTYPEMAIFYVLSDRKFPTWSWCHIMDVTSDSLGADEGARLLKNKPAVLIYMPDADELDREEKSWRFGRPSGNRKIIEACDQIAKTYRLARTYRIGFDKIVKVYVRPDGKKP